MALYWFVVLPLIIALVSYLSHSRQTKIIVLLIQVAFFYPLDCKFLLMYAFMEQSLKSLADMIWELVLP